MDEKIAALEARVSFLESWLQIPVQHLPGYVAPEAPVAAEEAEPVPAAEENAETNG